MGETPAGQLAAAVGAAPGWWVPTAAVPGLGDEGVGASISRGARRAGKITDLDREIYSCWHCVL